MLILYFQSDFDLTVHHINFVLTEAATAPPYPSAFPGGGGTAFLPDPPHRIYEGLRPSGFPIYKKTCVVDLRGTMSQRNSIDMATYMYMLVSALQ